MAEASKSKSWLEGYDAGYAGLVASQMIFSGDIVWDEFNDGYAVGCEARRNEDPDQPLRHGDLCTKIDGGPTWMVIAMLPEDHLGLTWPGCTDGMIEEVMPRNELRKVSSPKQNDAAGGDLVR